MFKQRSMIVSHVIMFKMTWQPWSTLKLKHETPHKRESPQGTLEACGLTRASRARFDQTLWTRMSLNSLEKTARYSLRWFLNSLIGCKLVDFLKVNRDFVSLFSIRKKLTISRGALSSWTDVKLRPCWRRIGRPHGQKKGSGRGFCRTHNPWS